jgi:hypothetical protein
LVNFFRKILFWPVTVMYSVKKVVIICDHFVESPQTWEGGGEGGVAFVK